MLVGEAVLAMVEWAMVAAVFLWIWKERNDE